MTFRAVLVSNDDSAVDASLTTVRELLTALQTTASGVGAAAQTGDTMQQYALLIDVLAFGVNARRTFASPTDVSLTALLADSASLSSRIVGMAFFVFSYFSKFDVFLRFSRHSRLCDGWRDLQCRR